MCLIRVFVCVCFLVRGCVSVMREGVCVSLGFLCVCVCVSWFGGVCLS